MLQVPGAPQDSSQKRDSLQACWSCDKACAKRAWRIHKLYCTDDPRLKRHVATELAFERVLAKLPKTDVPAQAACYICLDGGAVLRGCACRGPSAGFAHVDCLAEMAARDEWMTIEGRGSLNRWEECATCYESFTGVLQAEMERRWWRQIRDAPASDARRKALQNVSVVLKQGDEGDAADGLDEEAIQGLDREDPTVLLTEVSRAAHLLETNPAATIGILSALQWRMERCHVAQTRLAFTALLANALNRVGRFEEALPVAAECVQRATALHGPERSDSLEAMKLHAITIINAGRVDEGRAMLARIIATQTRVLGADHVSTRRTTEILDRLSMMEHLDHLYGLGA